MRFKKFPLIELVLSAAGLFLSIVSFILIQVAGKVEHTSTGLSPLAIIELLLFVLMIASLTANKAKFTRIVTIISMAIILFSIFVTAIVCSVAFESRAISWDSISFLTISILALVATILFFIYYLVGKNETLKKMCKIFNIFSLGFFGVFALLVIVSSFVGIYRSTTIFGINIFILLANICVMFVALFFLQDNLEIVEENKQIENSEEEKKE